MMMAQFLNKRFKPVENSEEYFMKAFNVKLLFTERPPGNNDFYI